MNIRIRRMVKEDIPAAVEIEKLCFSEPWTTADYNETLLLPYATYYVAEAVDECAGERCIGGCVKGRFSDTLSASPGKETESNLHVAGEKRVREPSLDTLGSPIILGIAGIRKIAGEGQISNVAVRPAYRGLHIAHQIFETMIEESRGEGVNEFTLEVRAGNEPAKALYADFGFRTEGVRPHFYAKPTEDALIQWARYTE